MILFIITVLIFLTFVYYLEKLLFSLSEFLGKLNLSEFNLDNISMKEIYEKNKKLFYNFFISFGLFIVLILILTIYLFI